MRPTEILVRNRQKSTEASSLDRKGTNAAKARSKEKNLASPAKAFQRKNNSASFMQIYVLEEQSGQIQEYTSLEDFKKKRLLQHKSGLLKGCIDRNGALGTIKVYRSKNSMSLLSAVAIVRRFACWKCSSLENILDVQTLLVLAVNPFKKLLPKCGRKF